MSKLYWGFVPEEGDQVQFYGIYVLKWPHEIHGLPTIAFVEVQDSLYEAAPDLLAACKLAIGCVLYWPEMEPTKKHRQMVAKQLKTAIAKATGKDEQNIHSDS